MKLCTELMSVGSRAWLSCHLLSFRLYPFVVILSGMCEVLANMVGANHGEATTNGPNRWSDYASAFFGCHLYRAAGTVQGSLACVV